MVEVEGEIGKVGEFILVEREDKLLEVEDGIVEVEVEQFKNGKTKLKGFFVGQLMKKTQGRVDPKLANQLLSKKLQA